MSVFACSVNIIVELQTAQNKFIVFSSSFTAMRGVGR